MPPIMAPPIVVATIENVMGDGKDAACAGSTTRRPVIVDGGTPTRRKSLTSSLPIVSFMTAVSF